MLNPILGTKNLPYEDYKRYARQIIIEEINFSGQQRIKQSKVICIGAGGLNSPTLLYLAACGIGTIGIIDHDTIEISNLQRQILYQNNDINKPKIKAAHNTLECLNPSIQIYSYHKKLNYHNIEKILADYDIILDGTDNFQTRYIISQYCYRLHKIHIYGAIEKFIGHISVFNYQNGTNYYNIHSNLYNQINNCNNIGVINTLAGITGMLQATETIKIITGIGSILSNYLLIFNILNLSLNKIKIKPTKLKKNTIKVKTKLISTNIKYISKEKIHHNKESLYKIIDIRTPLEFKLSHLSTAINIPFNIIKNEQYLKYLKEIKNKKIVIYCNNQTRSYTASKILYHYNIDHYILYDHIQNI